VIFVGVASCHSLQKCVDLRLRVKRLIQIRQLYVFEQPFRGLDSNAVRGYSKLFGDVFFGSQNRKQIFTYLSLN